MQLLGHRPGWLLAAWTAAGTLAALVPALWMWGFTVDDALIGVRYARHLAAGDGWRFNATGPSTDGVTPLPWPLVLAPLARGGDALAVLARARGLGLAAWIAAGAALGRATGRAPGAAWARGAALATLGLSVPVAAHAVSGMETALATALATWAALQVAHPRAAAALAGAAAAFRPEMAPWAVTLGVGAALAGRETPQRVAACAALAIAPFLGCVAVRLAAWGHPVPLAVLAKPSDAEHGLAYAGAACVVAVVPLLVLAPVALRREPRALAIVAAAGAQVAAIVVVGGDWMPYARLLVPVVPSLAYAAVLACPGAHPVATAVRAVAALALGVGLIARGGTSGRSVGPDREALVMTSRPALAGLERVAALDVGWVGAATDAAIVDLAGLTDPEIAALPGGHTSKRVDARFLLARRPDGLLFYLPRGLPTAGIESWPEAAIPRVVEARLARDDTIAARFQPVAWLPLGKSGAGYVLVRSR
jgi:hypothetical protein